jgi:hypothetical protein
MKTAKRAGWLAALLLACPLYALADPTGPDVDKGHGPDGPRLFLVLRMAEALDLSDDKALAVSRILKEADEKRDELRRKRFELEDKIRGALKQSKPDDAALAKLIDQSSELHKQQERVAEDSFNALKKVLTVEQQAKLVLLRSRLRHEFGPHMHEHGWHHGEGERGRDRDPDLGRGPGAPPPPPPAEDEEG